MGGRAGVGCSPGWRDPCTVAVGHSRKGPHAAHYSLQPSLCISFQFLLCFLLLWKPSWPQRSREGPSAGPYLTTETTSPHHPQSPSPGQSPCLASMSGVWAFPWGRRVPRMGNATKDILQAGPRLPPSPPPRLRAKALLMGNAPQRRPLPPSCSPPSLASCPEPSSAPYPTMPTHGFCSACPFS